MSSAKLSSLPAELKALAGFCSPVIEVSRVFVGSLQKDSFHDKLTKEVFRRAKSYMDKQGEPPRLELLQEDIGLSQSARDLLASAPRAPKTVEQAQGLAAQVKQYADTRRLYHTTRAVLESLEEGAVPIDELVDFVSQEITKLQVVDGATVDVVHYGKEGNADELVADILYGEDNDEIIPTGLESFDSVNGGFFRGSLVVCGANSGGGKSLIANQLSINQARLGYKSTMVPLEMSVKETTARILANVSGMDSINVFLKRLASGERDLVYKRYRRFQRECQRNNGRYTIYKPKGGVTIEQLINGVDDLDSDVIYVDYISLLDGADGDDQWRKLGQIARYSKIQAERKNRVIVLLVQVDEAGRVRYSQAVKEHASLAWTFVATKTSREQGYITIDMLKGRNQVMRPFTFKVDYPTMSVSDLSPDELARIGNSGDETGRPAKKKSASAADVTPDLAE
jgi:replicative DNA helicase